MSSVKKNLAANFLGKIWTTLMSVLFLPYYIKLMGVEAFGLVGVYTALLALFSILDLGLGNTLNREMARLSSQERDPQEFRNLTRTLEIVYWTVGLLMGGIISCLAPFLATSWIKANQLTPDTIEQAIYCIAAALALLWPSSLYAGGLMGLQRQVVLNGINIFTATLRGVGLVCILTFISPTIQAFFLWQIAVNIVQTALTGFYLWKSFPYSPFSARFELKVLSRVKKFALGVASTTLLTTILSQLDKVILSKVLALDLFGYYALATTIASALFYITVPVFSVFFPHFTQLISSQDGDGLKRMYHIGCQLMASFTFPAALLVIFFSSELLFVWTDNSAAVENAYFLVKLLMISTLFNAIMTTPFAMQLAHGWTSLSVYLNLFALILMMPLLLWVAPHYGATGVAMLLALLAAVNCCIGFGLMHRKILKEEKWRWCMQDVVLPFLVAFSVVLVGRLCFQMERPSNVLTILYLLVIYLLAFSAVLFVSPGARRWTLDGFFKLRYLWLKKSS